MAIHFFGLCDPSNHRTTTFGEFVRVGHDVYISAYSRSAVGLDGSSRSLWLPTSWRQNSCEIRSLDALHVSWLQWDEAPGLGLRSHFEQDAEWKGIVGGSSVQYKCVARVGPLLVSGHKWRMKFIWYGLWCSRVDKGVGSILGHF
jgi:hypothetical protein